MGSVLATGFRRREPAGFDPIWSDWVPRGEGRRGRERIGAAGRRLMGLLEKFHRDRVFRAQFGRKFGTRANKPVYTTGNRVNWAYPSIERRERSCDLEVWFAS